MRNLSVPKSPMDAASTEAPSQERDIAIDYLRAFVIVLVVFIHAALAYTSFSIFFPARWVDASAPIVDSRRWPFLDLFVMFFDTFMMPVLFFVSGLFALPSLERKGSRAFFIARLQRLGIPFVIGSIVIAPLAFYPSYLMARPRPHLAYLATFFTSDGWPIGPPWFLWVLLVFNGILALVHWIAPAGLAKLHRQPTNLFIFLITLVAFVPLHLIGSPYWWITSLGPFDVQPIRLGLYFAYFLLGAALGTGQQWRKAAWAKHWGYWFALGILAFFAYIFLDNGAIRLPRLISQVMLAVAWATSCAGASLGLLGAFRKFERRRHPIFDSLSTNAFGIYLIHYAVVLWIQFALLPVSWPAWIKFCIAFIGGLTLSWGISKILRQIPIVRRVL